MRTGLWSGTDFEFLRAGVELMLRLEVFEAKPFRPKPGGANPGLRRSGEGGSTADEGTERDVGKELATGLTFGEILADIGRALRASSAGKGSVWLFGGRARGLAGLLSDLDLVKLLLLSDAPRGA